MISFIPYLLIKPETSKNKVIPGDNQNQLNPLNNQPTKKKAINNESTEQIVQEDEKSIDDSANKTDFFDKMSTLVKRILGISLSIFSGLMYGQSNTPVTYVRNNYPDASTNALDHIFSYYTGILCGSIIYFVIYCAVKKNIPILYPKTILPGLGKYFFN